METRQVVIEDWEGDGGIRIPDEALQEMGGDVGDSLYRSRNTWARHAALCSAKPRAFPIASMSWLTTGSPSARWQPN
ncbi:hypothetical protein D9M71_521570 [compost metagenome]